MTDDPSDTPPRHRAVLGNAWLNPPAYAVEPDHAVPVDGYRDGDAILCNDHDLLYTECYSCNPR